LKPEEREAVIARVALGLTYDELALALESQPPMPPARRPNGLSFTSPRRWSVSGNGGLALTELAGAILDGSPIDWVTADSDAAPEDRPVVRRLKSIAAIARAHHGGEPETWGSLRLLEPIGRGAFGDVYRAWDSRLDRQVALKLLAADPSSSNQLGASIIEEGRLLARIRHPNVVTIYGAERIDDRVGLWMEYIDGRTLHQLVVEDGRPFSRREVAAIGQALCGAVAAVHAAGLLHRDIKAQNVMMARDGRVVLMDFGSGRDRGGISEAALAGTPLYLAPEVLSGGSPPSVQSDIYSTGVLLFFLLTGSYPIAGADLAALRHGHERGERRSLKTMAPKVPRRLRLAVERAIDPREATSRECRCVERGSGSVNTATENRSPGIRSRRGGCRHAVGRTGLGSSVASDGILAHAQPTT
jgi:eukaryotic-like serine/threonine-protein kinase